MFAETETVHEAPIGHLISAIVARLNPLAQAPKALSAPLEYRPTRCLAGSLGASDVGTTIAAKTGGNRGTITSVTRFVQDGTQYVQINATGGIVRTCRLDAEVATWAWETPRQPAPARSTPIDQANRRARAEMIAEAHQSAQERLASPGERRVPATAPRPLRGILTGLVG